MQTPLLDADPLLDESRKVMRPLGEPLNCTRTDRAMCQSVAESTKATKPTESTEAAEVWLFNLF